MNVALWVLIQKYLKTSTIQEKRTKLLNEYCDGKPLEKEEYRFLSETSELLNSCLDKKFLISASHYFNKKDIISKVNYFFYLELLLFF